MAYALVASTALASTTTEDITTSPIITTGANLFVAVVTSYNDAGATTVQDSRTLTWVPRTVYSNASIRLCTFYAENATGGTGHTFTTVGSANYPGIVVGAFSGGKVTGAFDKENGATNFSPGATTFQAGPVTPTAGEDGELIVAGCFFNPNITLNSISPAGFTILGNVGNPSLSFGTGMAYLIQTTAATADPTWTFSGTTYVAANLTTFKVAAAAAPAVDKSRLMLLGVGA